MITLSIRKKSIARSFSAPVNESSKRPIVVFSDPKSGSEEALGRVFNALGAAYDYQQAGDDVKIIFQAAGTRWTVELIQPDHPAFSLFEAVKDNVAGASCGCAGVFSPRESVENAGLNMIKDSPHLVQQGLQVYARWL